MSRVKRTVKSLKLRLVAGYFKASPYKNWGTFMVKRSQPAYLLALIFREIVLDQLGTVLLQFGPFTVEFKRCHRAGRHIHTA